MKYKIMTIAVASLLPLGFAASASANPTASHEVTFTVAEARGISVKVTAGEGQGENVLDLGTIAQGGSVELVGAVEVKFSSPATIDDGITVMLFSNSDLTEAAQLPSGVSIGAKAQAIGELEGNAQPANNANLTNSSDALYGDFKGVFVNQTFDVDFTLTATSIAETGSDQVFFIRYALVDNTSSGGDD
jgi:hypothetical protein